MSHFNKLNSSHWVLIAALLAAGYACFLLIQPYLNPIILAFIMSLLFAPLHNKISEKLPSSPNSAAILSCMALTFIIAIPLFFVFVAIIQQGATFSKDAYHWVIDGGIQTLFQHPIVAKVLSFINEYLPFDAIDPNEVTQKVAQVASQVGTQIVGMSAQIVGDVTNVLMNFFLMLFVLFFLLRDQEKIITAFRHVLPLSRSQEDRLLDEIEEVSKSAVLGSFLTAIAQGLAGGFAMWLAGFPGLFWGTMMGFASFIPVVGTALIWVPAAIYLLLTNQWEWALFLTIWGVIIVGSIDNIVRPLLMQGNSGMNTLLIFFSLLGGIQLFGLIGLIYGPIIFALTLVLFNMYETEFKTFLDQQDNN
ncbi:membrane protein [Aliivibrio wodanis]|uniref:Membrane protein n=1 Tax=Aliivibrio wodanis TaxID=80852 RepID=A0A090IMN9_9GAMM|nr:membrane protein [Aliivibrio wodanis]VVV03132.1 Putative transport protein [Aliivibrio wodanis]